MRVKREFLLLIVIALIPSCAGFSAYRYRQMYAMISPVRSYEKYYEDSILSFQFEISEKKVQVQVVNRGSDTVELDWPRANFVDSQGQSHSIANEQTLFTKDLKRIKPSLIGKGSMESNVIVPVDNIEELEQWTWYLKPFFNLTEDSALLNGNKTIGIVLPVKVGEEKRQYNFQFMVVNVVPYRGNTPG